MYYILHIPTGHYVRFDKLPLNCSSIDEAELLIKQYIEHFGIDRAFSWTWSEKNKCIGYDIIKEEFEIIEINK